MKLVIYLVKVEKPTTASVSTPAYCLDYGIANTDDKLGRFIDDFIATV